MRNTSFFFRAKARATEPPVVHGGGGGGNLIPQVDISCFSSSFSFLSRFAVSAIEAQRGKEEAFLPHFPNLQRCRPQGKEPRQPNPKDKKIFPSETFLLLPPRPFAATLLILSLKGGPPSAHHIPSSSSLVMVVEVVGA